jgi:hypothetical protein
MTTPATGRGLDRRGPARRGLSVAVATAGTTAWARVSRCGAAEYHSAAPAHVAANMAAPSAGSDASASRARRTTSSTADVSTKRNPLSNGNAVAQTPTLRTLSATKSDAAAPPSGR